MQPVPWSQTDINANVARKLEALRALKGGPPGESLDQRLARANDRIASIEKQELALQHYQPKARVMSSAGSFSGFMSRADDGGGHDSGSDTPRRRYTAADDSYAASPKDPAVSDEAEVERDAESERRLLEANQRQTSEDWVVLDRLTVLAKLATVPEGLTLAKLGALMLGENAKPRDTRRLSAMMKREEERGWVVTAGRGLPITMTEFGRTKLEAADVAAGSEKAIAEQAKRLERQKQRLMKTGAKGGADPAPPTGEPPPAANSTEKPDKAGKPAAAKATPKGKPGHKG
jgi:hypothetical protein